MKLLCTSIVATLALAGTSFGEVVVEDFKLVAGDPENYDRFGYSVSISGDYAVIGAWRDDTSRGSAYVFHHDGTTWTQQAKLVASDGSDSDNFGVGVAISGDYAVIGAYGDDDTMSNSGSAYVFHRDGTTWTEQAKLVAADGGTNDRFGYAVSISGDYAVIGAYGDWVGGNSSGSAYVFHRNETTWTEQAKLVASDSAQNGYFGTSVSISGDYAVVGAYGDGGDWSGAAYVFHHDGTTWTEQTKLVADDGSADDYFGVSVSISGDYAVIGAYGYDNGPMEDTGAAYVFHRDGTTWTEQALLVASSPTCWGEFGVSVAISGDYAVIGEDSGQASGCYSGAGDAYVFRRHGTTWQEQSMLVSSDMDWDDSFGYSVSISGDKVVCGAFNDDDNGWDTGSGYVYTLQEPEPWGACCINMDCVSLTETSCTEQGGAWLGVKGSCDDCGEPPVPTGACCVTSGCDVMAGEMCTNLGGTWTEAGSCDDCPPTCAGDINADGEIDIEDLLIMIASWGVCP